MLRFLLKVRIGNRFLSWTGRALFQSENKEAVKNQDADVKNLDKAAQWVRADALRIFYGWRALF
jgi:hypothetical protein